MSNKYTRATPRNYTKYYMSNSDVRDSLNWHRDGLIWRTLATHPGMTTTQVSRVTGLSESTLYWNLKRMSGVRREGKKWHAEGVTKAWKEVL